MPNDVNSKKVLTTNEAAKIAGVTAKTIRNWRKKDYFEYFSTTTENGAARIWIRAESFFSYMKGKDSAPPSPKKDHDRQKTRKSDGIVDPSLLLLINEKDARIQDMNERIEEQRFVIQELREQIKVLKQFEHQYNSVLAMNKWDRFWSNLKPVDTSRILEVK